MQDFRNLKVWQKSHELVLAIYRTTEHFPKREMFSLTSQIRRSAMSVPMNIAEGCGRGSDADFCRFLQIALGSASEAEYQLLLSRDLKYVVDDDFLALSGTVQEIKRMLSSLMQKIKSKPSN